MLTQDDYRLYTNDAVSFTEAQWNKLVNIAASRLARFLCLESLTPQAGEPLTAEEYDGLNLTATDYDSQQLTAEEYDTSGKTILLLGGTIHLPEQLELLLANFLCIMLGHLGDKSPVQSKHVRNFTVTFAVDADTAFGKLKRLYGDIIEEYSQCNGGVCVERSAARCCYGYF